MATLSPIKSGQGFQGLCFHLALLIPTVNTSRMDSLFEWTKDFDVSHPDGSFRAFISRHGEKQFYATLLYHKRRSYRSMADIVDHGACPDLEFASYTAFGSTEHNARQNLEKWMRLPENLFSPGVFAFHEVKNPD